MFGGAVAGLTGLVVVAMSIHLRAIATARCTEAWPVIVDRTDRDPRPPRCRAVPGQTISRFGAELLVIGVALQVMTIVLAARDQRASGTAARRRRVRIALYRSIPTVVAAIGVLMVAGVAIAPYLLAIALLAPIGFIVNNVWALLIEISGEKRAAT
jgi:hypothetical protein